MAWPMRAVGGRSAVERGKTATPGSLVCSEDHQTGQAAWPVSTGLMATQARPWGRRDAARAPGLGGAAAGLRLCLGGDENILELDSGDAT